MRHGHTPSDLIKFHSYTTVVPEWMRSALEHNNSISIESNVGEIQSFASYAEWPVRLRGCQRVVMGWW